MIIAVAVLITATLLFLAGYVVGGSHGKPHGETFAQANIPEKAETGEPETKIDSGTPAPTSTEEPGQGPLSNGNSGSLKTEQTPGLTPSDNPLPNAGDNADKNGRRSSDSLSKQGQPKSAENLRKRSHSTDESGSPYSDESESTTTSADLPRDKPRPKPNAQNDGQIDPSRNATSADNRSPDFKDRIHLQLLSARSPDHQCEIGNTNGVSDLKITGHPVHIQPKLTEGGTLWNVFAEDRYESADEDNHDVDEVPQILTDDESTLVFRYGASSHSMECVRSLKEQGFLMIQWADEGNEKTHVVRCNDRAADVLRLEFEEIGKPPTSRDLPCPEAVEAIKITKVQINDPSRTFRSLYETRPTTSCEIHATSSDVLKIRVECKQKQDANKWFVEAACYWENNRVSYSFDSRMRARSNQLDEELRKLRERFGPSSSKKKSEKLRIEDELKAMKLYEEFKAGRNRSGVYVRVSLGYDVDGEIIPVLLEDVGEWQ